MISVVLPLFNEMKNGLLQKSLPHLINEKIELIIIDGGSSDGTLDYLEELKLKYHSLNKSTRLCRLKKGIELAQNEFIILHHPRSILEKTAFKEILYTEAQWGGFTHQFNYTHPLLQFTSFYSNFIRGDLKSIFYLDHCIFLRKHLAEKILAIPDCEIFEDTEISLELSKSYQGKRLKSKSTTSAIRFLKNGIFKQAFLNQKMKWLYYKKHNHKLMNKEYEKNLNLNNETK